MQKILLMFTLSGCIACTTAQADVLVLHEASPAAEVSQPAPDTMPSKGDSMRTVLKGFGEPKTRHKPAGGDTRRNPAITRWDYAGFSVFFERNKVIDSVIPGQPATLHHTDKLEPLDY
jgi:hypothetical protein